MFERQRRSLEVNLIPLINIVFLLLIFFLVVGVVKVPEPVNVSPPISSEGVITTEPPELMVFMTLQGTVVMDKEMVGNEMLKKALSFYLKLHPNAHITIKADKELPAKRLVELIKAASELGAKDIAITVQHAS